ncbi:hypothetical protein I6H59_06850 [Lactococcus garvieae]|nr:hypothetical protein [Lactococcus petauri]QQB43405.1 hypothetical protein I6H59_06850 [Lactococcus garvieae]CEF50365.1 hypothetical protein LGMT14_00213 [Lactococcus garvieae]
MTKNNLYLNQTVRKEFGSNQEEMGKNVQTRVKLLRRIKKINNRNFSTYKKRSTAISRVKLLKQIDSSLEKL